MSRALKISPSGKVFRDPIHQLIRIDPKDAFILALIDTPEFQRLRRIRQLGVSSLTYPGAEHSRFTHSLGVFNFVQRMLEVLGRRYAGHEVATYLSEHGKIVKAAALLHDIGHGPFSHMIERAFKKQANHEKRTVAIIKDCESGVGKALLHYEIDPDAVADIIQHTSRHQLLTDMVTSQLDADRMDYLLRDSYCTGVQYGRYDQEWLLNSMCVGLDPLPSNSENPKKPWRLALDEKRGEKAAEQFILARAHMNDQVYFHRVTRGFEVMLLDLFRAASEAAEAGGLPDGTPPLAKKFFRSEGQLDPQEWLHFDESIVLAALHAWSASSETTGHPRLSRLSTAFLRRECMYASVSIGKLELLEAPRLFKALEEKNLKQDRDWSTDDIKWAPYKGLLSEGRSQTNADGESSPVESILLSSGKPDHRAKVIERSSSLMEHLGKQRESVVRLYFDQAKSADINPVLKEFGLTKDSRGEDE